MKHLSSGMVVLAASVALWSCGDPTSSFRGQASRIDADPSSLFLAQGESKGVIVNVVDAQGNPLDQEVTATPGTGITVALDTTFLPTTTTTGELTFHRRFNVTAVSPVATSFTLSSGALTQDIPVKVMPIDVAATFSNPTPAANELLTVTAQGFKFLPGSFVAFGTDTALTLAIAADSSSITVLPTPGGTGFPTIGGIEVSYAPGALLTLPATTEVTVGAIVPAPGTGSTGTAPNLPVPPLGGATAFFDAGTFTAADITADGGLGAQYYKLVITEAGDYTITTNWAGAADIDAVLCSDASCSDGGTFAGTGITQPEQGTLTLAPATYYLAVVLFDGAPPANFSVRIDAAATPAP